MASPALFEIRPLEAADIPVFAVVEGGAAWNGDRALWITYLREQAAGERIVRLAVRGDSILGYGTLLWNSAYPAFAAQGIPEINNLVVAAPERRRGVATALIREFELLTVAAGRSSIGIGVGLYADYGAAQRLYWKLGFQPDGRGVTYAHHAVQPGQQVRLDDDFVLWLIKPLETPVKNGERGPALAGPVL